MERLYKSYNLLHRYQVKCGTVYSPQRCHWRKLVPALTAKPI